MSDTSKLQNLIGEILLWQNGQGSVELVTTAARNALPALRVAVALVAEREESNAQETP